VGCQSQLVRLPFPLPGPSLSLDYLGSGTYLLKHFPLAPVLLVFMEKKVFFVRGSKSQASL
jgi:hypothetical protein